jgi:hypothetical protein
LSVQCEYLNRTQSIQNVSIMINIATKSVVCCLFKLLIWLNRKKTELKYVPANFNVLTIHNPF